MDQGERLEALHAPGAEHGLVSSLKRQVRTLGNGSVDRLSNKDRGTQEVIGNLPGLEPGLLLIVRVDSLGRFAQQSR